MQWFALHLAFTHCPSRPSVAPLASSVEPSRNAAEGALVMVQDHSQLAMEDTSADPFANQDEVAKTWDQLNETVVDEREGALLLAEREQMLVDEAGIPWKKVGGALNCLLTVCSL
jgi:hypothetical protein